MKKKRTVSLDKTLAKVLKDNLRLAGELKSFGNAAVDCARNQEPINAGINAEYFVQSLCEVIVREFGCTRGREIIVKIKDDYNRRMGR